MFISGKVCLLSYIDVKRQTLPEINVHAHLFGTLEYIMQQELHEGMQDGQSPWTQDQTNKQKGMTDLKCQS